MDTRLNKHHSARLHSITRQDLPALAEAIVGVIRYRVSISTATVGSVSAILFKGDNVHMLVPVDDWAKLHSKLLDSSWTPDRLPQSKMFRSPSVHLSSSRVLEHDLSLYRKILADLTQIFTTDYPTGA